MPGVLQSASCVVCHPSVLSTSHVCREQLAALQARLAQLQQVLHHRANGKPPLGAAAAGSDEETALLSNGSAVTTASPRAAASPAGCSSERAAKRRRLASEAGGHDGIPAAAGSSPAGQRPQRPAGQEEAAVRQDSSQQGGEESEELPVTQEVAQQSAEAAHVAALASAMAAASAASPFKTSGSANGFVLASSLLVQECASQASPAAAAAPQPTKLSGGFMRASDPHLWAGAAGGHQQRADVSPAPKASAGGRYGTAAAAFGMSGLSVRAWDGLLDPYAHLPLEQQASLDCGVSLR